MNNIVSLKKPDGQLAKKILTLFLSVSAIGFSTSAQSEKEYPETVISASKVEESTDKVSRSVTVISREQIEQSTFSSLSELLSQQAGIYIVGTGQTPGSLQRIFLRGANSDHSLILIDGVRISDPSSTDNAVNLAEISLSNIERIEIIRGAHSTLYGTAAIGGIINIITRKSAQKGLHANASVQGGTFGKNTLEMIENLQLNYSFGNGLYVNGSVYHTHVNGIDATEDTITNSAVYNRPDQDGFNQLDLGAKVGFKNKKWDAFGSFKHIDQSFDIDDGAYQDDDNYTIDNQRNVLNYQVKFRPKKAYEVTFYGGYTNMDRTAIDDSSVVDHNGTYDHAFARNTFNGEVFTNDIQLGYFKDHFSLILGGNLYQEKMGSTSFYTNTAWNYTSESNLDSLDINAQSTALYAHAKLNGELLHQKLSKFNLSTGVRFTNFRSFGSHLTYEINPSYNLTKETMVYLNWGTGFNAPALYRLYSPNSDAISGISRGNESLSPETSKSIEFGVKQSIGRTTTFTASIFQTTVNDLIDYVYLWDNAIGIDTLGNDWQRNDYRGDTYLNIGDQVSRGFEVSIRTELSQRLTLIGNISIINGSLSYSPTQTDFTDNYHVQLFNTGDFLTTSIEKFGLVRRSNTANLSLNYQATKKLNVQLNASYTGSRSDSFYNASSGPYGALNQSLVQDYTLFGGQINYQVLKQLSIMFSVKNILDTDYQEIFGYQTRGRGFYAKVNFKF